MGKKTQYIYAAPTWLADFGQQSVWYTFLLVCGVSVTDINEQTLDPVSQLLSDTVDCHHLLGPWLQTPRAGRHCEHPYSEVILGK